MSWADDAKQAAAELSAAFDVNTGTVRYTDPVTAVKDLDASVGNSKVVRRYNDHGVQLVTVIPIIVENDKQVVRSDATITIDGEAYSVESKEPRIGGRQIVNLQKTAIVEKSRGGYRG